MPGLLASPGLLGGNATLAAIDSYLDPRRNAIIGFGAGLAGGRTPGQGIALGLQGAMQGRVADTAYATQQKAEAERNKELQDTASWLRDNYPQFANLPPDKGFELAAKMMAANNTASATPASVEEYNFYAQQETAAGRQPMSFGDYRKGGNQQPRAGVGQPIYGRNKQTGTIEPWQSMSDGTMVNIANPNANPADYNFDPGVASYQRAEGTAVGRGQGAAQVGSANDISAATTALDLIDQIKSSPELGWATGTSAGLGGNKVPGTGRYGFQQLVDQAKNGAFLTAVQQMRGLGALSNAEGDAAKQAITRMDTALSKEDFTKALDDYQAIVERGKQRAEALLANSPYQEQIAPPGFPAGAGGRQTSTGVPWSIEP